MIASLGLYSLSNALISFTVQVIQLLRYLERRFPKVFFCTFFIVFIQLSIFFFFLYNLFHITMETDSSTALFDTTDLVLLGAIGLGTAAWFSRRQIADLVFGKKKEPAVIAASSLTQPKRETNFVKVMEQQVRTFTRPLVHHLVIDMRM